MYLSEIKATNAKRAITAAGLKESSLDNFQFKNINIEAVTAGEVSFANGWNFDKVQLHAKDNQVLNVKNSMNMNLQ